MTDPTVMSEPKRRLLEKYLRGEISVRAGNADEITPRATGDPVPLTFGQEQVWRRDRLLPDMPRIYNESVTVRRNGPLDVTALQRSVDEIVRRHEIWRTTFEVVDGRPVQIIHSDTNTKIREVDLRGLPEVQQEGEGIRIGNEEVQRPFNLQTGPLVRFTLFRFSGEQFWLLLAAHQIVLDGVSAYQVFLPELVELCRAFSTNRQPSLTEGEVQFGDFAIWQRRQFDEKALAIQVDYWRKQLGDAVTALKWPDDKLRPQIQTFRGAIYPFALPRSVADAALKLSQQHNVTLFATLMAVFATQLYRYTGQNDLIIGTVAPAGRDRTQAQRLMGYLLNPVPLRFRLSGEQSFSELSSATKRVILEAMAHDDIPFEHVAELLGAADTSRNPLFQVAGSLEPAVPDVAPGWDLTPMDFQNGGAKWDLYFVWEDRPAGLTGRVQYNLDLFRPETIVRLVEDFRSVLESVARDPRVPLSELAALKTAA